MFFAYIDQGYFAGLDCVQPDKNFAMATMAQVS
jgi:hypothetical protein